MCGLSELRLRQHTFAWCSLGPLQVLLGVYWGARKREDVLLGNLGGASVLGCDCRATPVETWR